MGWRIVWVTRLRDLRTGDRMSNSPTTTAPLRLCIVNGYPEASRENFDRSNVGHPHDLFKAFLAREAPNATSVIVYVADPDFSLPPGTSIEDFDGFIWTGSDLTVYHTDDPRVAGQLAFAEALMDAGAASWGSCWGLQMGAQVEGGAVKVNPRGREWGIARSIELTDEGKESSMLAGKPNVFDGFIMHLDEVVRLPIGTHSLGGNAHTPIQAAIYNRGDASYWATQYHPEYNLYEMGRLIAARAEALVREGHFPDEESVSSYAQGMIVLHGDPSNEALRDELDVGNDIIDPEIRELELRNWLRFIEARAT